MPCLKFSFKYVLKLKREKILDIGKRFFLICLIKWKNERNAKFENQRKTIIETTPTKYEEKVGIKENDFKKTDNNTVKKFADYINSKGITATVRRTLGADIDASCGQLRRKIIKKEGT